VIALRKRRCISAGDGADSLSRDAILAQLRQKGGRPSSVRKRAQCAKGVLGPQCEHSTERVGINANPAELAQESLKRLLVGQPDSVTVRPGPTGRTIINKLRIIPISKIVPSGLDS